MLPLGLRVQNKVEALIDKHMTRIGASKVSLSSLSSQDLWRKSGRFDARNNEFFKLEDRKAAKFILSPTHEEEITTLVAQAVRSHNDLPLRLYQVTRKYRDEARPRQGLLRGREFIMKDLYTFDSTEAQAMETYETVRGAYKAFFDEIGMRYLVAAADSGNMGGNHSHEYHFPSDKGEDVIVSCNECDFVENEELYRGSHPDLKGSFADYRVLYGRLSTEGSTEVASLVKVYLPRTSPAPNVHAIKDLAPQLDTRVEFAADPKAFTGDASETKYNVLVDPRIDTSAIQDLDAQGAFQIATFSLSQAEEGESCPKCSSGHLQLTQTVEIGHTFHLHTRYSKPLHAQTRTEKNELVDISMGCHGIGISRLVGAAASLFADEKGLNWPSAIAPFTAVIITAKNVSSTDAEGLHDQISASTSVNQLQFDAVIDDRQRGIGWALNDADLIGYPFIVVLGRAWTDSRQLELQCRRLNIKELHSVESLMPRMRELVEIDAERLALPGNPHV